MRMKKPADWRGFAFCDFLTKNV
ncbi:hypothetical protein YPPY48_4775, partial [Yersinia pestis PY-48]